MLLRIAVLTFATVSLAHADSSWEARVGAGFAGARMPTGDDAVRGTGMTLDLDVLHWSNPRSALGLYAGLLTMTTGITSDGATPHRDLTSMQTERVHRETWPLGAHAGIGWQVSYSGGLTLARDYRSCETSVRESCTMTVDRSLEVGFTGGLGTFAYAGPLVVTLGARAQVDSALDAAVAMQASAGAIF